MYCTTEIVRGVLYSKVIHGRIKMLRFVQTTLILQPLLVSRVVLLLQRICALK